MFCQKCGAQCDDEAKFCSACGSSLVALTVTAASNSETTLQEKVFFNSGEVLVSDAVFKSNTGASYPIRNISSVAVERGPASFAFLFALALTTFGVFLMPANFGAGLISVLLSIPLWRIHANNRSYILVVGSGGVLQTAIESTDGAFLKRIAATINDAIVYIQRGK